MIAALGFAATLPILNVDAFIVKQNVQRAVDGHYAFDNFSRSTDPLDADQLDISYFMQLSPDAIPPLVAAFRSDATPDAVRDALGAALACIRFQSDPEPDTDWRSYHASRWTERRLLDEVRPELKGYFIDSGEGIVITPLDKEYTCYHLIYWD
jgi:hypothetical protein